MSDAMSKAELLSPGLEPMDLGPGEVEKMFGPAETPLERFRAAGRVEETPAEMGGGEPVNPVEEWIQGKGGYQKILDAIQQNKWTDGATWPLTDAVGNETGRVSVAEIKRRAAAAASPPPLEPEPAPRPANWRDSLPSDQRQRLREKEQRWGQLQPVQLTAMQEKISTALSNWGLGIDWPDEFKKANLLQEEAGVVLRALGEEIDKKKEIQTSEQLRRAITVLGLRTHFDLLKSQLELPNDISIIEYLRVAERQSRLLLQNLSHELFPPEIKNELISLIRNRGNGGI